MKHLFFIFSCLLAASCCAFELDQHAKAIEAPLPSYPFSRYEANELAFVSVLIEVDSTGAAKVLRVMNSSFLRFDNAAKKSVENWKFRAAIRFIASEEQSPEPPDERNPKEENPPLIMFLPPAGNRVAVSDVLEFIFVFDPKSGVKLLGPLYEN